MVKMYPNRARFKFLAKADATIFKNSIQNSNQYDWIGIILEVLDDHGGPKRSKRNVFVFRLAELN